MFYFFISNLNGKRWTVSEEVHDRIYWDRKLKPFVVASYNVGKAFTIRLDCSDTFLKLLVNDYFNTGGGDA